MQRRGVGGWVGGDKRSLARRTVLRGTIIISFSAFPKPSQRDSINIRREREGGEKKHHSHSQKLKNVESLKERGE